MGSKAVAEPPAEVLLQVRTGLPNSGKLPGEILVWNSNSDELAALSYRDLPNKKDISSLLINDDLTSGKIFGAQSYVYNVEKKKWIEVFLSSKQKVDRINDIKSWLYPEMPGSVVMQYNTQYERLLKSALEKNSPIVIADLQEKIDASKKFLADTKNPGALEFLFPDGGKRSFSKAKSGHLTEVAFYNAAGAKYHLTTNEWIRDFNFVPASVQVIKARYEDESKQFAWQVLNGYADPLKLLEKGIVGIFIEKMGEDEPIRVESVLEGSISERMGVRGGDIIVTINGQDTISLSTAKFSQIVRSEDPLKLEVKTDAESEIREILIHKQAR